MQQESTSNLSSPAPAATSSEKEQPVQAMASAPVEDPFADFKSMDKPMEALPQASAAESGPVTSSTADIMNLFDKK
jgi:hypothetical protein